MKIKFMPQNVEVDINPNKSVLAIALENGIGIHSICKGVPSCAECRIKIAEGEHNVNKPSKAELALIGNSYYIDGRRLSCQVRCFGPVTIDTSEQISRQDNPAKKIRGFKSEKQYESKAILDTMLLNEVPLEEADIEPVPKKPDSRQDSARDQGTRNHPRQNQQGQQGRDQNRSPNQQQGRDQNRNQNPQQQNRNQNQNQQNRDHNPQNPNQNKRDRK